MYIYDGMMKMGYGRLTKERDAHLPS
jgi:hypothetical protein